MKKLILAIGVLASTWAAHASALQIFPDWIDFGAVPVGERASRTVNIRNGSNEAIYSIEFNEFGDSSQFTVDSFSCFSLQPFQSCSVQVEYEPNEIGSHNLDIDIWSSEGSDRVSVSGQAYDPNPVPPAAANNN